MSTGTLAGILTGTPHTPFLSTRIPHSSPSTLPLPRKPFPVRAAVRDTVRSSFYELLGIPSEGSFNDVKRAYKRKARMYHPDVCPPERTEEYTRRFIEVKEAYETLSDPRAREVYDRGLRLAFEAGRRWDGRDDIMEEKSQWKSRWQSQLSELNRRSMQKESDGNLSWGARMRMQRAKSTAE